MIRSTFLGILCGLVVCGLISLGMVTKIRTTPPLGPEYSYQTVGVHYSDNRAEPRMFPNFVHDPLVGDQVRDVEGEWWEVTGRRHEFVKTYPNDHPEQARLVNTLTLTLKKIECCKTSVDEEKENDGVLQVPQAGPERPDHDGWLRF